MAFLDRQNLTAAEMYIDNHDVDTNLIANNANTKP